MKKDDLNKETKKKEIQNLEKIYNNYNDSIQRFQNAIKIATISYSQREQINYKKFKEYIEFIKKEYVLIHKYLTLKMINEYNFLYKWEGKDKSLKPVLFMAHYDVVPVEDESKWENPPFSGKFDGQYIWGRGSQDDKLSMISIIESVEFLLKEGFSPERTIYLAFGHDEEIGGYLGAKLIKEHFKKENIQFEYVIDEGSIIAKGLFPGIDNPIALIGVTEKGHVNIEISVKEEGGHASMPPAHTASGKIAKFVTILEDNPMKPRIISALKNMLLTLGSHSSFLRKIIFKNSSFFKPLILKFFASSPTTNALIRTTFAVTMLKGSNKENILPQTSYARINVRLLYPDSIEDVINKLKKIAKNLELFYNKKLLKRNYKKKKEIENEKNNKMTKFKIKIIDEKDISEPSKEANLNSQGFKAIKKVLTEMFDNIIVSPFIVVGATDSRYFDDIADNVFKFIPVIMEKDELKMIHGNNEKVRVTDFINVIKFYKSIIKKTC